MLHRWPVIVALTVIWVLLWGEVTPLLVVGGVLVSVLVLTVFPFPPAMWEGSFHPAGFVTLMARFAFDLVKASVEVSWLAVRPSAPPRSAVIRVDLESRSEFLLTITAELVSLVPGSLLVEIDPARGSLWLHILDAGDGSDIDRVRDEVRASVRAQERRVLAALGPQSSREACTPSATGTPPHTGEAPA